VPGTLTGLTLLSALQNTEFALKVNEANDLVSQGIEENCGLKRIKVHQSEDAATARAKEYSHYLNLCFVEITDIAFTTT